MSEKQLKSWKLSLVDAATLLTNISDDKYKGSVVVKLLKRTKVINVGLFNFFN